MSQLIIPTGIKYGYHCYYRCETCHRNVYENYQWLGSTFLIEQIIQDKSKCPYCGADIDFDLLNIDKPTDVTPGILRFPSKDYAFVFKTDQSVLSTVNITVNGILDELFEVNWGDGNKIIITLTGVNQLLSHNYRRIGDYYIKIFCKYNILTYFKIFNSKLSLYMPTLSTQVSLAYLRLDGNSLSGTIPSLSQNTSLITFALGNNNLSGVIPSLSSLTSLYNFQVFNNNLSGTIPSLSNNIHLYICNLFKNSLSGTIPSLSNNTSLRIFRVDVNNLTGSIPDLSNNAAMYQVRFNVNNLSGLIPDLTNNTVLQQFLCNNNSITGYTPSTLALSLNHFTAQNNMLTSSAVNQVLADFVTNLASRPASGKICLHGTGNQAPTGQGITDKNAIISHGWQVFTN